MRYAACSKKTLEAIGMDAEEEDEESDEDVDSMIGNMQQSMVTFREHAAKIQFCTC